MFRHYLTTAVRHFSRNKFTTGMNVLCLAMGMTCFAAAYGVVAWFTNADRHYANSDRIYFVTESLAPRNSDISVPPSPMTSWVLGSVVRSELKQVAVASRLTQGGQAPIAFGNNQSAFAAAAFADPEFLEIFDLPFIAGDSSTALRSPRSAVVTQQLAQRVFGRATVVGETLLLRNRERITITGVVSEFKQPSHFGSGTALVSVEMLVSMDTYESIVNASSSPSRIKEALGTWGANMNNFLYVLVPEDGSIGVATLNHRLGELVKNHAPTAEGTFHVGARPIHDLYTTLADGVIRADQTGVSSTAILLVLGGLILLVSCINYANLATAQATTRAKEVAMRRIVGAGRAEIIRQYLFETALLTLAALTLVLIFTLLFLGILSSSLGVNLLSAAISSPELWTVLLGTLVTVTLIAGAYPALVLSRMRPLQALRTGHGTAGPRFVPTVLVGLQFGAASFLLIALLVVLAQNRALDGQRHAVTGEPVLAITTNIREAGIDMQVLRNELLRSEHIELVAAADEFPGGIQAGNHRFVANSQDAAAARIFVTTNAIDQHYFKALDLDLLSGRNFDTARADEWNQNTATRNDVMNIVINSLLAERAGWSDPNQAVGQIIHGLPGLGEHELTMRVVGVVETKPLALLSPFGSLATVYTLEPERARIPIIRLSKANSQAGIAAVEATWKALSPNVPLRRVFLDEAFERTFRILPMISNTFAALALFAFLISAMGLIGMATHVTARRTREIGVRKTLGASVSRILSLLLRDFSKPVVIANLLIWPLAYFAMSGFISLFTVQTSLTAAPFALGLAITVGIACASVGLQATKAARMNPAAVLRQE